MSFYAMTWAWESAPVASITEKSVLMALANEAGPDGCNAFPSTNTIAEQAMISPGTATKVLGALRSRGLIAYGNQDVAAYLPANYRPTVYDVQIPFSWYSADQLKKVNAERVQKGLPPLTPENRPPLGPAPERKARSDKGVANPARGKRKQGDDARGVSETPLAGAGTETASEQGIHARGVSEIPLGDDARGVSETGLRGVSETPNPVLSTNPGNYTSPLRGDVSARARTHAHTHPPANTPGEENLSSGKPQHVAETVTKIPTGGSGDAGPPRARPCELPDGWAPSPEMLSWAESDLPGLDAAWETEEFVAYWRFEAPRKSAKKIDWERAWKNRMRDRWIKLGLDRRPRLAAPVVEDLFTVDIDGSRERREAEAEEITATWMEHWRARGTVLPKTETTVRRMIGDALAAGADAELVRRALVACGEPCPPDWKWQKALAGVPIHQTSGGGAVAGETYRERDRRLEAERDAEAWRRALQRQADGTADDADVSVRTIIEGSMRRAEEALRRKAEREAGPADEKGGAPTPLQFLRGEIAQ